MQLLERDELLATLQMQLQQALPGPGRLVFVEGEAGIGKTVLLKAFAAGLGNRVAVRWGACDALETPSPLAPMHDIAAQSGGGLKAALDSDAARPQLFSCFVEQLTAQPSVVLLEDLHWADQATLDLLRYTGRRISQTRSLVVGSYRGEEVLPGHPLRLVLGDLASAGALRLKPQALSVAAVRALAGELEIDTVGLHRKTGGNPFFVTEVLAVGGHGLPATVRDAVLARAARLRPSARAVLDAAAVAGPRIEPWLLRELAAAESAAVEDCLASGVLQVAEGLFAFRHELARQAILEALEPTRLLTLHRLVLQALESPGAPAADPARLAHHAEAAGLAKAVLKLAPAAARAAAARGAHSQAAEQYARALRHSGAATATRAALLDDYAVECHVNGDLDAAIEACREAASLWQVQGEKGSQAAALARLAIALVGAGRNAEGEDAIRRALALAARSREPAASLMARRWHGHLRMLDRDARAAMREARAAMKLAKRLGDEEALLHSYNVLGSAMIVSGRQEEGIAELKRSLALAEEQQSDYWTTNALSNLGSACGEAFALGQAEHYLQRAIDYCQERDIDYARLYALSWLALVRLYLGRWHEAAVAAHEVLDTARAPAVARMMALIALGRLRARRGDPGTWEALDEARALAGQSGTVQRVAPMRAARAEAAWLEGRAADAAGEAAAGLELALQKRHPGFAAELLYWTAQEGKLLELPAFCRAQPSALELTGRWQAAASAWHARGCPFETARALAAGDERAQREALATFESLGARPMVERVRHALRAAGVRGLPLGPRESTRSQPAGLTRKELEVLALLCEGLRNKAIAERLNRSPKTIAHHLSAIFVKLGVASRAEAVSAAHRLGLN